MMKKRLFLRGAAVAVIAALYSGAALFSSASAAQNKVPETVANLGPDIVAVEAGGYWSKGATEGFYRAIVTAAGVEHVNHSLFLQWIKTNIDDGAYSVVSSVSIDGINKGHTQGYGIKLNRDQNAEFGKLRLKVTVSRARSNDTLTYELSADEHAGKYKLVKTK